MKTIISAFVACLIVAACGGSSSPAPAPPSTPAPTMKEGLYLGKSLNYFFGPSGQPTSVLVLEQQEVWVLDGRTPPKVFGQGPFAYSGKSTLLNGTSADVFVQARTLAAINSNILGERSTELRFSDSLSTPRVEAPQTSPVEPLRASFTPTTSFDYNQAANIVDVAGQWGLVAPNNDSYIGVAPLTVSDSGDLSTPRQESGCSVAGTLKPRASGKNVFNLSITLTGCADAGEYTGIAFKYMDTSNFYSIGPLAVHTLRLIATNKSKTRLFNMTTTR